MTLPVHIAGGVFLTGVAGALAGISILEPVAFFVTCLASVLPDIDHTKSPVGKLVPPLSRYLNRSHGHRNLTHSAAFTAVLCVFFAVLEKTFFGSTVYSLVFCLAYSSHIFLDMFTLHGVGLFYPFVRNMAVLPGNAKYRVRTGNPRTEAGIFVAFCIVNIGALPLLQQGFWTSYNRTFSTPNHLVSEYQKSSDLLLAKYEVGRGSMREKGEGFVIHPGPSRIVLFVDGEFRVLNSAIEKVVSITPQHTGREVYYLKTRFQDVSPDSLRRLTSGMKITKGEVTGSRKFLAFGDETRKVKLSNLVGFSVDDDSKSEVLELPGFVPPARIHAIEKRISDLVSEQEDSRRQQVEYLKRKQGLLTSIKSASDYIEREKLQAEYTLLVEPTKRNYEGLVWELRSEKNDLMQRARQVHQEREERMKQSWLQSQKDELTLSGYLEYVEFDHSSLAK